MSREEMVELWTGRINDYRASGERATAWCERNQVTPDQLYYWMRKLKKTNQQVLSFNSCDCCFSHGHKQPVSAVFNYSLGVTPFCC